MTRLLFSALLLLTVTLEAAERKYPTAVTPPQQQKIIYTNKRLSVKSPVSDDSGHFGTYLGLEGQYATGIQTERTRLSEHLYRENDEAMIYNEVTFKLGFGDIGEDRFELGLTVNKGYSFKDSTVKSEFDTGRSLDASYSFIFDALYEKIDTGNIIPFFRIGVGIGQFDIKEEYQSYYNGAKSILATDYKYGAGLFMQLTRRMEFSFSYDIVKRQFQKIEDSGFDKEIIHNTGGLSFGINYHF